MGNTIKQPWTESLGNINKAELRVLQRGVELGEVSDRGFECEVEFCQPEKGKEEDNIWGRECESQHEARQVQEMLSLVTEGCMWRERGRNMGLTGR